METAGSASYDDEPSSKSLDPHFGVTRTAIPEHADETALPKPACLRSPLAHGQALTQGNVAGQPAAIKLIADLIERRPEDPTESEFEKMTARILSDED